MGTLSTIRPAWSSLFLDDLRDKESAKIECGKAHFKALAVGENPAELSRPGTSTT
jgi:hypothetical protein